MEAMPPSQPLNRKLPAGVKTLILLLLITSLAQAEELDDYTKSVLRWIPLSSLEPSSVKTTGILPFTAGKIPKEIYGHRMSIGGSTIASGSILAGSPSRVVYKIPKEGYIALKGRVTLRDYEITQCVVKILGDGKLLWESAPLRNENKTVKPERFFIDVSEVVTLELVTEDTGKTGYAPYVVWIRPEIGKR